jgi:hypothetical protein
VTNQWLVLYTVGNGSRNANARTQTCFADFGDDPCNGPFGEGQYKVIDAIVEKTGTTEPVRLLAMLRVSEHDPVDLIIDDTEIFDITEIEVR